MPSEAFKAWLEAKPYKTATKNTYWNDLIRIERHYGDLDEAYDRDKLSAIRTALNYTAADRRDGRKNPATFPIDGDVYRNLSAYRAKLAVYAKFREEGAVQGTWVVQVDALLALKERFLARYQDFSPDFFTSVSGGYWQEEREYKEVIISRVQGIIEHGELTDEARGRALLEILQKPPANFVNFRAFMQIKAAGESAMLEIATTLGQMLMHTGEVAESFDEAAEIILPLMKRGAGSGSPTGNLRSLLSTTLALARPLEAIAVKTEYFNRAAKALIGRPVFRAAGVTSAEYQDALALAGHVFNVMRDDWNWAPKDLWDVQGFLWVTDERYREEKDEEEEGAQEMPQESLPSMAEPKNLILYGPPGTGKTYATAARAVELCDGSLPTGDRSQVMNRYRDLVERKRISFVTFHQSYAYEDFVEGLRPQTEGEDEEEGKASVGFSLKAHPGIFRQIAEAARENRGPARQAQPLDRSRRVFKMSLGRSAAEEGVRLFKEAIDGGYIVLGWGGDVDWSDARYDQPGSIRARWQEAHKDATPNDSNITQTYTLRVDMRVGDYVIVSDGNRRFRAIGEIVGPYQYVPNYIGTYNHRRPVRWLWYSEDGQPRELIYSKEFSQKSAYQLRPGSIDWAAIEQVISTSGDGKEAVGTPEPYVLIIDEINRANISRVFGELITLIEPDKRLGGSNPLTVVLPHSGDTFGVPSNLHIIGTMNTADRSIALLDTALRRRFEFEELMPDPKALAQVRDLTGIDLPAVLEGLNQRIEYLFDRDHQIGHAYFMACKTPSDVEKVMRTKVIPLLAEYFYEDWEKVRAVLNEKSDEGVFVRRTKLGPPASSDQDIEQPRWRYEKRSGFAPEDYDQLRA